MINFCILEKFVVIFDPQTFKKQRLYHKITLKDFKPQAKKFNFYAT